MPVSRYPKSYSVSEWLTGNGAENSAHIDGAKESLWREIPKPQLSPVVRLPSSPKERIAPRSAGRANEDPGCKDLGEGSRRISITIQIAMACAAVTFCDSCHINLSRAMM
jgi:hypothetical protein